LFTQVAPQVLAMLQESALFLEERKENTEKNKPNKK